MSLARIAARLKSLRRIMDWQTFDEKVKRLADTDRSTPIEIGDALNEGEEVFGEQFAQVLVYFPQHKSQTIINWKSICRSVPKDVRPIKVRISQMDAVRALTYPQQKVYLGWAVDNDYGREEIQERMQTEGLLIPRTVDCTQLVEAAIKKLDKALPFSAPKMKAAIELAVSALQDGMK
jgi:hypothetical protein